MLQAQMRNMKYFSEVARNKTNASTTDAPEEARKHVTKYQKENPAANACYSNI